MILQIMFPSDSRIPYRNVRDRFSEESTPITQNVDPVDPYFARKNSLSSDGATINQDSSWKLLAEEKSQDVRKDASSHRHAIDATNDPGANSSSILEATLHHMLPVGVNESLEGTRESNKQSQDGSEAYNQRQRDHLSGFNRASSTSAHSQQSTEYDPKLLAEEFNLQPAPPEDDEDSISSDVLDEDIWAEEESHQPNAVSRGTKRSAEDSFLDLIETSLASRRFSLSGLSQLSNSIGLEGGESIDMRLPMSSIELVQGASTSGGGPRKSQRSNKRVKTHQHSSANSLVVEPTTQLFQSQRRLSLAMYDSIKTQRALQERDRKNGLPASHCQTMVNSSRSREQLLSGMVLQKWNGVPLLMLPGAPVKVTRHQFRGVKVAEIE